MADGDISAQFTLQPGWEYAPDLDTVAALLRAYLYVEGQQHDTFDTDTRPTADQASELITQASAYVRSRVGDDIPEELWSLASHVTSRRAAMLIIESYFPEALGTDSGIYPTYAARFDEELAALMDAMSDQDLGGEIRFGSMPVMSPTVAGYIDVFGTDPRDDLPQPDVWDEI